MKKFMKFLPLAVVMFFASCNGGEDQPEKISLKVDPTELKFAASGNESQIVTVTATGLEWESEISAAGKEWITVTPSGDNKLSVTVTDNESDKERSASVMIKPIGHAEIRPIGVVVIQDAGGEVEEYSISLDPAALTFLHDATESQQVTVTTVGEGLTWSAEAEEKATWLHVQKDGDKIVVSVDSYDNTEISRSANIIVTPDNETAKPKSVRITQEAAPVVPILSVSPMDDIHFEWNEDDKNVMLAVTAIAVEYTVMIVDENSKTIEWLKCAPSGSSLVVSVERNHELVSRSGYVVLRSHNPEVDDVRIFVEQGPGKEFMSNLTGDVEITDMNPADGFYFDIHPRQVWDKTTPYTYWVVEFWGGGLTRTFSKGYYTYSGTGERIALKLYTTRINYNDDMIYYIPDGEYVLTAYEYPFTPLPNTLEAGRSTNDFRIPSGGWYNKVVDGEFTDAAPLTEGKLTVSKDAQDVYTFTFDFKDDAGYAITGTCVSEVTDFKVTYFPDVEPTPNPDPEEPEDPDFGKE